MQQPERSFNLPMMLTFLESKNGHHAVHSLDFDIVCVENSEEQAWNKLRLAVQTYVEFGLSRGWKEHIMFNAPKAFWDKITPDVTTRILEPITLAGTEKKVIAVHEPADGSLRAAS
ncbi:MAG: hypothetical protein WCF26_15790 [Candidatus Sulfotelmatobacter sp.]